MPIPGIRKIISSLGKANKLQGVAKMKRAKKKRNNLRKMKR